MTESGSAMPPTGPPRPAGQPEQPPGQAQPAAPPSWAWVQPAQATEVVETEPLEYHELLRGTARYRWWKPLLLLLVAGAYFGVFTIVVTVISLVLMSVFDPQFATDLATGNAEVLDTQRPISVLIAMLSIVIMIPSVLLAMLTLGMRPVGRVWSVAGRIRWGLVWRMFGAAVLSVIVMNAVGIGIGVLLEPASLTADPPAGGSTFSVAAALTSLVLILLFVPFQSTAEELMFRGLFMQVIGSWKNSIWCIVLVAVAAALTAVTVFIVPSLADGALSLLVVAVCISAVALLLKWCTGSPFIVIALPTVAFAAGHIYDVWGLAAVGLLGVLAAWLTWRTGGLEAAIGIHVANNLIVFALMTSGAAGDTAQTADGAGPAGLIGSVVGLGLYLGLAMRIFRRGGYGRTRIDLIEVPVAPTSPQSPVQDQMPPRPGEMNHG